MARTSSSSDPAHVLIVGGKFGAVEAMLALHSLAPERRYLAPYLHTRETVLSQSLTDG